MRALRGLGFTSVSAFLASGNVVFEVAQPVPADVEARVETGLSRGLGHAVPTFLRTEGEVRAIAAVTPFPVDLERAAGKPQVILLRRKPTARAGKVALAQHTEADRLVLRGRELHWLPSGKLTESDLDFKAIEAALGPVTVRTKRTVERIAAKYFAG